MQEYNDFTTVESCLDGDVILIGEEHGNKRSGELACRVLSTAEPGAVAYEMPPGRPVAGNGAMSEVRRHGINHGLPTVTIDIQGRGRRFRETTGNVGRLYDVANRFETPIQTDGDLDERAIRCARTAVKDEFGHDTWRAMYPEREVEMARWLLTMHDVCATPIVAAIGAFHVPATAEFLAHEEPFDEIPNKRYAADNRLRA